MQEDDQSQKEILSKSRQKGLSHPDLGDGVVLHWREREYSKGSGSRAPSWTTLNLIEARCLAYRSE